MLENTSGKTKRCLISPINRNGARDTEPMLKHLSECEMFKETCDLYLLRSLYNESDSNKISLTSHVLSQFYKIMKFLI